MKASGVYGAGFFLSLQDFEFEADRRDIGVVFLNSDGRWSSAATKLAENDRCNLHLSLPKLVLQRNVIDVNYIHQN